MFSMNICYKKLPAIDLNVIKVASRRKRSLTSTPEEIIAQDTKDAETILNSTDVKLRTGKVIEATEKYLVERKTVNPVESSSKSTTIDMKQQGVRKPHYTRLLVFDKRLVLQAACCLPLKVIAASLDGEPVSGRVLFNSHTEKEGGKLVYEFQGKGAEMVLDLKRGESARAQRLIFKGIR